MAISLFVKKPELDEDVEENDKDSTYPQNDEEVIETKPRKRNNTVCHKFVHDIYLDVLNNWFKCLILSENIICHICTIGANFSYTCRYINFIKTFACHM